MDENKLFNNWQRALIVSLQLPNKSNAEVQSSLEEMASLTYSLGVEVVGKIVMVSINHRVLYNTHIHTHHYTTLHLY